MPLRLNAIDALRALTMLLMIFVNDLWSLHGIPAWLEHTAAEADGMGLADTVFPAFLFIVGMSIPLSIAQRKKKGETPLEITLHIMERAAGLLVMGLFLVNGETINEAATGMPRVVWNMLCCFCFILIWNSWPKKMNVWLKREIKGIAIVALFLLAWLFRGGGPDNIDGFATHWWGILGLIGWAYLVTALLYFFTQGNFIINLLIWIGFLALCMASHAGMIPPHRWIHTIIGPLGEGSMPAFTMGGALVTTIVLFFRNRQRSGILLLILLAIAILLFAAGVYTRTFWGISKIRATPAWVLICSAITIVVFIPIYWLSDIKGNTKWFWLIKPAGTNTLLCYVLPYFAYGVVVLLGLSLPASLLTGGVGLVKSLLFSLLMVGIAGGLGRIGVRLKL